MQERRLVSSVPFRLIFALTLAVIVGLLLPREEFATMGIAVGLIILVGTFLRYDRWSLPLVLVSFFWAGLDVPLRGVGEVARWGMLTLVTLLGIFFWVQKRRRLRFDRFHLFALLTVLAAAFSFSGSVNPNLTLLKAGSVALLFLYCSTGLRISTINRKEAFIKALLLASEIATYVTAVLYLIVGYQVFGSPNSLGAVMGVIAWPVLFCGVLAATEDRGRRYRLSFALLVCGMCLLYSLARAGLLAAILATIVILFSMRMYRMLLVTGVVIVATIAALTTFMPDKWQMIFEGVVYKGQPGQEALQSRRSPWEDSINQINQAPWFGTGFGAAKGGSEEWIFSFATGSKTRERANSYLAVAEGMGLVGCIPFALLLFTLIRRIWFVLAQSRKNRVRMDMALPLAGVLVAGLFHAFFEDWLLAVGYYLCVVFWAFAFLFMHLWDEQSAALRRQRHAAVTLPPRISIGNASVH